MGVLYTTIDSERKTYHYIYMTIVNASTLTLQNLKFERLEQCFQGGGPQSQVKAWARFMFYYDTLDKRWILCESNG